MDLAELEKLSTEELVALSDQIFEILRDRDAAERDA